MCNIGWIWSSQQILIESHIELHLYYFIYIYYYIYPSAQSTSAINVFISARWSEFATMQWQLTAKAYGYCSFWVKSQNWKNISNGSKNVLWKCCKQIVEDEQPPTLIPSLMLWRATFSNFSVLPVLLLLFLHSFVFHINPKYKEEENRRRRHKLQPFCPPYRGD